MAVARFGELCLDANDPARLGRFWAGALDRQWRPDDWGAGGVFGPTPGHTLWFDKVAERKVVKHRVHLDIYTTDIAQLQELGASVVLPEGDDRDWIVMADPEGGEFCADLRAEVPVDRLHGLVFDSIDPTAQAQWWAGIFDADVEHHAAGWSTVERVTDMPILTIDFVPVPEPKATKNRIHPGLSVSAIDPLVAAGASMLREPDSEIDWYVVADPEGNEFCVFVE